MAVGVTGMLIELLCATGGRRLNTEDDEGIDDLKASLRN
jgi:hypothetical protein